MSNERERLAREWAERAKTREVSSLEEQAAADHVLATTTEPTMADVEWSDEKHRLAGATTPKGDKVAMLWHDDSGTDHIITDFGEYPREYLTPNGKRYELREVTGGEHPETLTTVEDYRRAHLGTIIAGEVSSAWQKTVDGWVLVGDAEPETDLFMAKTERTVLRWGWVE